MLAIISLFIGILIAVILLAVARGRRPDFLGWFVLPLGLLALAGLFTATQLSGGPNNPDLLFWNLSITLSFEAVIAGIGTLARGGRAWTIWVGLLAGLLPAVFWLWFTYGYIIGLE